LKALLPTLPKGGAPSEAGERRHLCPRCQVRLTPKTYSCVSCRLQFKDGARGDPAVDFVSGRRLFLHGSSLVGDRRRHRRSGIVDRRHCGPDRRLVGGETGSVVFLPVLGAALAIEKAETIYHAKHYISEYIPENEKFLPLTAPS
jgi:hypothetical protein